MAQKETKRPRTAKGRGQSSNPSLPYPSAEPLSEGQQIRLNALETNRKLQPSRWICPHTLNQLGLTEEVEMLTSRLGLWEFLCEEVQTYRRITIEFLSSYEFNRGTRTMTFNLGGYYISLHTTELLRVLGLSEENVEQIRSILGFFHDMNENQFRHLIMTAGLNDQRVKNISHPTIRYLQRVLSHTLFARGEVVSVFNEEDMTYICCMLRRNNGEMEYMPHIGYNLAKHMKTVANNLQHMGIDRISTLPDDLLIHVLSFLSIKEAVQTCILAKSWRNTWASLPVLKFKLLEFLTDSDLQNDERRKLCKDKFEQFIHGVLKNKGKCLDEFQYEWCINIENDYSMEWLDRVVTLMPRVINIIYYGKNKLEMPNLVFSCISLQKLKLNLFADNRITIIRPKRINLPSLKVLNLCHVDLDDDFARKLFLGCPALESLYLCFCNLGFFDISSKVLETLALNHCSYLNQMQICCPRIVSLDIHSYNETRCIALKNTASLANVDIALRINELLIDDDLNIFRRLSNVSTMKLVLFWFDELKENFEKNIPDRINFNNLKTLDLGTLKLLNLTKGKNLVAFFLRHSPQLQRLTLRLFKPLEDAPEEPSKEESVGIFQRDYLDTVRITICAPYCGIVKWKMNDPLLRQIIKYLHDLIKKIGNIIIS